MLHETVWFSSWFYDDKRVKEMRNDAGIGEGGSP